jgi:hypothetical protein
MEIRSQCARHAVIRCPPLLDESTGDPRLVGPTQDRFHEGRTRPFATGAAKRPFVKAGRALGHLGLTEAEPKVAFCPARLGRGAKGALDRSSIIPRPLSLGSPLVPPSAPAFPRRRGGTTHDLPPGSGGWLWVQGWRVVTGGGGGRLVTGSLRGAANPRYASRGWSMVTMVDTCSRAARMRRSRSWDGRGDAD